MSYNAPTLPKLILTSTFLFLLPVTSHLSTLLTNTDLLGPLTLGILWCSPYLPPPAPLLPQDYIPFLSFLGYVGLILLIFDAGLSTPTSLLLDAQNLGAAIAVGLTGILVPIALSIALFHAGFGFSVLTSFAAGACLCSTSLGTTVSLLSGDMKRSRVGVVLMSAALLDDVVGLVVAGVIGNLVTPDGKGVGSGIRWSTIVRPVLVSLAYAVGTPLLAVLARRGLRARGLRPLEVFIKRRVGRPLRIRRAHVHLFVIVGTLMAFVATTHLAGTSELFGAYLAGAFLGYVFEDDSKGNTDNDGLAEKENPILTTFTSHIAQTLLQPLLSPLFFASIGAAIPVNHLFTMYLPTTNLDGVVEMVRSHRVVWRGIVYSLLMILAKMVTGVWLFAFWKKGDSTSRSNTSLEGLPSSRTPSEDHNSPLPLDTPLPCDAAANFKSGPGPNTPMPRVTPEILLGMAMVARGEIALIVAQLARPLLVVRSGAATGSGSNEESNEPYVIVVWAILVTTFAGALGVGLIIKATAKQDVAKKKCAR